MRTFVEKILNAPAGSIVIRRPDIVMSHDNSARIRKIFLGVSLCSKRKKMKLYILDCCLCLMNPYNK